MDSKTAMKSAAEAGNTPGRLTIHEVGGVVSTLAGSTASQAQAAHQEARTRQEANLLKFENRRRGRPVLSIETFDAYMDWLSKQFVDQCLDGADVVVLMKCAELVVSKHHAKAQAKATTATLVEDGTIPTHAI